MDLRSAPASHPWFPLSLPLGVDRRPVFERPDPDGQSGSLRNLARGKSIVKDRGCRWKGRREFFTQYRQVVIPEKNSHFRHKRPNT